MTTPTQPTGSTSTQSEPHQETPVVAPTSPLSSSLLASSSTSFSFGQNNSATSPFALIKTPTKPFTLGQTRPTTVPKAFAPIRTYAHDPTYYKSDGDCTVLVGGILFKVHRFLLTRDSSKFQASLPQSPNGGPGSSDDYPITVFSDLEEFRALCWVLYALPHETNLQNDPKHVDIPMLTSIARISRKYEFHNIERWSLDLLKLHLRPESACTFADTCSAASISSLLELSVIGKLDQLERFIVVKWLDRIRKGELEIWYALAVAERLKLRDLQGQLYYIQVTKLSSSQNLNNSKSSGTPAIFDVQNELSKLTLPPGQQRRLTGGFWSLTLYWLKLLDTMASVPTHITVRISSQSYRDEPQSCSDRSWVLVFQKISSATRSSVNYLDNIDRMVDVLEKDPDCKAEFQRMCSSCREKAKKQLVDGKAQLEASITDCFLGQGASEATQGKTP